MSGAAERWMVDSTLLSGPYANHLCAALTEVGGPVRLIGRPVRPAEFLPPAPVVYEPLFYRIGERFMRSRSNPVRSFGRMIKGVEHALGLMALVRKARRERPMVVHFSQLVLPSLDLMAIRALRGVAPVVMTVHNSVPLHGLRSRVVSDEDFFAAYRASDVILAHTETTRATLLARGVPAEKIHMITHPPLALARSEAGKAGAGDFTLLQWGGIKKYKGVETLVEAARLAIPRLPNLKVRVVGKAFYDTTELEAEAAQPPLDQAVRLDLEFKTEPEIDGELSGCDVVVFPYHEIDTSGAFPTSLQYGKAFILSAIGGFAELDLPPEVRRHAFVPPGDAAALAESIVALGSDREAYLANVEAFKRLYARLETWTDVARKVERVYRDVAARTSTAAQPAPGEESAVPAD